MYNLLIFGTGSGQIEVVNNLDEDKVNILAYIDNDNNKQGHIHFKKKIIAPTDIKKYKYDYILVASQFYREIYKQLIKLGVDEEKIVQCFIDKNVYNTRFGIKSNKMLSNKAYEQINTNSLYSPWNLDEKFKEIYNIIFKNTLVDKYRCYELWNIVKQCIHLDGDVLEVGVWRGGTAATICKRLSYLSNNKTVYLADTFNGVVKASEKDSSYEGGEHNDTSQSIVEDLLNNKVKVKNYKILKGIFPDDTGKLIDNKKFCFCHIDVDVYNSTKDIVDWIWPKMSIGSVIIFDDYGTITCDGIAKYLDYMQEYDDRIVIYNLNGHGVMVKTK